MRHDAVLHNWFQHFQGSVVLNYSSLLTWCFTTLHNVTFQKT